MTDALRYVFLYQYGGVYLDTDVVLLQPLPTLSETKQVLESLGLGKVGGVGILGAQRRSLHSPTAVNGAVAVFYEAKSPFLWKCMETLIVDYDPQEWISVGPGLLTTVFKSGLLWDSNERGRSGSRTSTVSSLGSTTIQAVSKFAKSTVAGKLGVMAGGERMLLLPQNAFYAVFERTDRECCWLQDETGCRLSRIMEQESYTLHWSQQSSGRLVEEKGPAHPDSLCVHLLNKFCILCLELAS